MAERRDGQDPGADDHRDGTAEADGPGDVGGGRVGAVAEAAAVLDAVAVAVGAAQPDARARRRTRPRSRRSWATGAGGRPPSTARSTAPARPGRRSGDRRCGDAGRHEVEHVVEAGAGPAEPLVAGRVVADHGVERVGGPVGQHGRRATDGGPQRRGHHGVRRVLGDRLDDGPGDAGLVEVGGRRGRRASGPARRAPSRSPAASSRPTAAPSASSIRPATATAVATATAGPGPTARRSPTPTSHAPPTPTAAYAAPAARESRHITRSSAPIAVPNQATGCQRAGGSPSHRSATSPSGDPDRPAHRASAANTSTTASSWSGRGRATRNVPGSPKLVRSRTITPCRAPPRRAADGRCARGPSWRPWSTTDQPSPASDAANAARRSAIAAAPRGEVGDGEQRLDDGGGQPVHRPPRLAGGDPLGRGGRRRDHVAQPQPGAGPQLRQRAEAPGVVVTTRPRAGGQRPERLVPHRGDGRRPGQHAQRVRRVRPPPPGAGADDRQVAPVQRELRVDHLALPQLGGDEGDGLGAAVRQHQPVGSTPMAAARRGGRRRRVRVPAEPVEHVARPRPRRRARTG